MGFRFFRRVRIAPGITLNLSKRGVSVSGGVRGAKVTLGTSGRRATVGIPGTGLFYTQHASSQKTRRRRTQVAQETSEAAAEDRLSPGFFKRLTLSEGEKAFVDACRALRRDDRAGAMRKAASATGTADCAFLAGIGALQKENYDSAGRHLLKALDNETFLGSLFDKYALSAEVAIQITDAITARVGADRRGVLLALAEAYQAKGSLDKAIECLQRLRRLGRDDPVIKLSLAELLFEQRRHREVVKLLKNSGNENEIETACLLFQGKSLAGLGLNDAALQTLTKALRRKKDRAAELLREIRYERAVLYQQAGKKAKARREFEMIYAEEPDFEDVAQRVGL